MTTVPLTMELLCEFLRGPTKIDNPYCQFCGLLSEVYLDPQDVEKHQIKWIGIGFRRLAEMIGRRPSPIKSAETRVLEFHLKGKARIEIDNKGKREYLVIPTKITGEEVKIMK